VCTCQYDQFDSIEWTRRDVSTGERSKTTTVFLYNSCWAEENPWADYTTCGRRSKSGVPVLPNWIHERNRQLASSTSIPDVCTFCPVFLLLLWFSFTFFSIQSLSNPKKVLMLFSQPLLLLTPHAREKEEEDKKYIKTAHMPLAAWEYDNRPTRSLFCRPAERKRKTKQNRKR
jgi:hypothetical protein